MVKFFSNENTVVLYVRLTGQYFFYKYYKQLKRKTKTPKSIKTGFIHIYALKKMYKDN